jgi:uncharacterized protein YecE (DUF72 family)
MRGGAACFTLRVLKSRELEFSSRVLNTIEINASHYSLAASKVKCNTCLV